MIDKKIRILHIAHRLTGKADGVYRHLMMLFQTLDRNICEQILIYSDNLEIINSKLNSLKIKVYPIPELSNKFPVKAAKEIYNIIKKEEIDIIHTHLVKPYLLAGLINYHFRKKLIFNYHGAFLEKTFYSNLEIFLLNRIHRFILEKELVDLWIFPSKKLAKEIISNFNLDVKYKSYYNGYYEFESTFESVDQFKEIKELRERYFLVAIIGRIDKWKRIDVALKVLKKILSKELRIVFVFIGDGEKLDEMKNAAENLELTNNVYFYDYISDVSKKLYMFDVMLITSEKEGFPLTIWEAMFNRVPIVSSDVGGIREILEGENCGIVYPFGNIEKCAEIIIDLYNDREKLRQLGMNGYKAVIEKYNSEKFKKFFENLYSELVNEK